MNDERITLMKYGEIGDVIKKLSLPAIVGMLVMAIYNVVDSIFVSWTGEYGMAAIQVVLPIMLIASAIGLSLGMGGGSYISRLLGNNKTKEASVVASVSFFTGLIIGLIVIISSLIYLEPILKLFGSDANTHELAIEYGKYITIGFGFTILNMIMNNMLRSEGSAKYSMIGMLVGSVVNIILDPILIFGFDMGIAGAAIATTVSQIISTIILLIFYLQGHSILKISTKLFKPTWLIYKEILVIALPTFARQLLVSVSMGLFNNVATKYGGTDLLSATSIVIRVILIPNYIVFGLGQGFQPVAGYNFGAKNKDRVIDSLYYSLKITTLITLIFFIIYNVFTGLIFDIYDASDSVRTYGYTAMRWYTFGMLFLGISNTIGVFYQSIGKGLEAMILSVARQGLFLIPAILFLPRVFDTDGVLMAQTVGDISTVLLAVCMVYFFIKRDRLQNLIDKKVN